MKVLRNCALGLLVCTTIIIVGCCSVYNYMLSPTSKSDKIIEIEIPSQTSSKGIASILKENDLIKDERFFIIYIKIFGINNLKAGYYDLKKNMGVKEIISILRKGSLKNPNEVTITIQEGLNMREIAKIISNKTNNSYDDIIAKSNDAIYITSLKEKYWFITDEVNNESLYYKLEGYLYPNTYKLTDKDVSIEYIFGKMLDQMKSVLDQYKEIVEKHSLSIHEILTLASIVEKESARVSDRIKVASVFMNRKSLNMPLGSDVTTRYACKIDNKKQVLTKVQYATKSLYNTRLTDGTMNGKLPVGPICAVSKTSIEAAITPDTTNYIYFIANIQTLETFYYSNYNDFLKKKDELAAVNGGF